MLVWYVLWLCDLRLWVCLSTRPLQASIVPKWLSKISVKYDMFVRESESAHGL